MSHIELKNRIMDSKINGKPLMTVRPLEDYILDLIAENERLEADRDYCNRVAVHNKEIGDQLKSEVEALRKDAELHQQVQRAAGELPYGWQILIRIEKDAGNAELIDPKGNEVDYASNHEYLADSVSDAIDEALSDEKTE
jgi:hypothetical protein